MKQSSSFKFVSALSLGALALTACAGDQEFVPANQAAASKAATKTLDFSGSRPKEITVGPDDTVYGIAYTHGVSTKSLVALNDIPSPYVLKPGQVLQLPQPNEHIVSSGETLPEVAAMYGVKVDALARENEIITTASLTPKQRLRIPSADTDPVVAPAAPIIASSSLAPLAIAAPKALDAKPTAPKAALPDDLAKELAMESGASDDEDHEEVPTVLPAVGGATAATVATAPKLVEPKAVAPKAEAPKAVATAEPTPTKAPEKVKEEPKTAPSSAFIWPAEGKVISKFGAKDGKVKNDGINIQVAEGTAVKAAQAGEVIYAGNELKGFGNLVLIKHPNGLKTAYAHNKQILVKKGDKVKQGQTIAKSGKSGDVKTPQLHFEIREGTKAIDPMTKLGS